MNGLDSLYMLNIYIIFKKKKESQNALFYIYLSVYRSSSMEDEDFEEQLKQEELHKLKEEDRVDGKTYKDKDGTEYEWDEAKKAWFPKVKYPKKNFKIES